MPHLRARYASLTVAALVASALALATAHADGPSDEKNFVAAARNLSMNVLPRGHDSTDADILAGGYRACGVLDQHPNDPMAAAHIYFRGGYTTSGEINDDGFSFIKYAAAYLCDRNSLMFHNI
jgi:hypothetical protein